MFPKRILTWIAALLAATGGLFWLYLPAKIEAHAEMGLQRPEPLTWTLLSDLNYFYIWYPEAFENQESIQIKGTGLSSGDQLTYTADDRLQYTEISWDSVRYTLKAITSDSTGKPLFADTWQISNHLKQTHLEWHYRDLSAISPLDRFMHRSRTQQRLNQALVRFKKFCEAYKPPPVLKRGKRGFLAARNKAKRAV
ncbi:MAG TPA: hypothetical protein VFV37_08220 [Luteibaculaceae bacterium]|nr:hypothetical protein [Luteibaculaceae bacterium]